MGIEHSIDTDDLETLRRAITGLAVECPVDLNPEHCKLHNTPLFFASRMVYVLHLTPPKVNLYPPRLSVFELTGKSHDMKSPLPNE